MSGALFDLEHLQQLSYERSKTWAIFLDNVVINETHKEIDLDDLEEVFGSRIDDQYNDDELDSMEDDDCDELSIDSDILRNVTNFTRLSIMLNKKSVALPECTTGVNGELADLFNQTLPIISEHHRQLKEYGFDRILNTFDKKNIEEKVGSWLNRHNSLYGGDATLISGYNKDQRYQKSSYKSHREYKNIHRKEDESNDSDDTLHSGETARYIRSSRAKAMKNTSSTSTTTMIKTYRMVKSKREALREKYGCEQDDDETHIKAIRHRRRIATTEHGCSQKSHKRETYTSPGKHLQKRKVLHKRNTYSTRDNSSDSDSYYYDKDDRGYRKNVVCCSNHYCTSSHATYPHTHRSAMKMPPGRSNRICYFSHSLSKSISTSSSSSASLTANYDKRQIKRNRFYNDSRPCRRESECRCCNDKKLCQDYVHVADISTEEWFVENCYSPKKPLKTFNSKTSKPISSESEYLPHSNKKGLRKTTLKNRKKSVDTNKLEESKTKQELQIKEPKTTAKKKNKKDASKVLDDTFNIELQMAIEASKKLYEEEQENKTKKKHTGIKEQRATLVMTPLKKFPIKVGMEDDDLTISAEQLNRNYKKQLNKSSAIISKCDENIEKLPQFIDLDCDDVTTAKDDFTVGETFVKPQPTNQSLSKPLVITSKITKNSTIAGTEETFFAPTQTQAICNSTAMPNDTQAYNRQFSKPLQMLIKKKVNKNKDAVIDLKKNRKRQTTKSSTVIAKDDVIKGKVPKCFEHDESSLLKPAKKIRKNPCSSFEETCYSNGTNDLKKEKSVIQKSTLAKITASATTSTNISQKSESTMKAATSTVTSTTIRSPDTNSSNAKTFVKPTNVDFDSSLSEHSDCTLVTSTTNIDAPEPPSVTAQTLQQQQPQLSSSLRTTQQQQQNSSISSVPQNKTLPSNLRNHRTQTAKGILIYTPQNRSLVPAHNFSNDGGYFTINKEHLSTIIGEKPAEKFLKYHVGRRRFNSNSTIYFKPPSTGMLDNIVSSSSESDDCLDIVGRYGDLYESFKKTTEDNKSASNDTLSGDKFGL